MEVFKSKIVWWSFFLDLKKNLICNFCSSYNHAADPHMKIVWQVLRENCKRKAKESISCRLAKIIRSELLKSPVTAAIRYLNI